MPLASARVGPATSSSADGCASAATIALHKRTRHAPDWVNAAAEANLRPPPP